MTVPAGRLFAALVEGPSMVPALRHGDAILVLRTSLVRPGDIVVARFAGVSDLVVKRAVRPHGTGWWVEGDNALVRDDSRRYGPAEVVGRVLLRWWPPVRLVKRAG
ncbi:MAG TPA: S24/S26 family peptidase [Rugosimonospora sp.]|nr:S24/S26 family peptidase [Rugosimonospora sp.]